MNVMIYLKYKKYNETIEITKQENQKTISLY
jgi:hypothetical protein